MKRLIIALLLGIGALAQPISTPSITLTAPPPPSVTSVSVSRVGGNAGSGTYYYWVVANYVGGRSAPSAPIIAINVPNTLSVSVYMKINWGPLPLAVSYDVLRTTSPVVPNGNCNCAIVVATSATTVNDEGAALVAYTASSQGGAFTNCTIDNLTVTPPVVNCAPITWGGLGGGNVTTGTTLDVDAPIIGAGGVAVTKGTRSGNTTQFATTTGPQTIGNCVEIDADGNHIASSGPCGTPSSGTWELVPNAQVGTTYAITAANCGQLITFDNAASIAVSLPATPLASDCTLAVKVIGAGDAVFTPLSGTISNTSAITLSRGEFGIINSNGTNYTALTNRLLAGLNIVLTKSETGTTIANSSSGGGDVVGPASAVDNQTAIFDLTTGKLIKASTLTASVVKSASGIQEAATASDISALRYILGGGTAQAQTVTLAQPVTAQAPGLEVCWLPIANNTAAAPTLSVNGLAAMPITKLGTTALVANDITTIAIACAIYDGTQYQLQNPQTVSSSGGGTTPITWYNTVSTNPLDSTTYYIPWSGAGMVTSESSAVKFYSPIAGTITALVFSSSSGSAVGTSESVTITLRINGADTAITGTMAWDGATATLTTGTFTGSIALAVGDIISVKAATPAWVNNPTVVRSIVTLLITQ